MTLTGVAQLKMPAVTHESLQVLEMLTGDTEQVSLLDLAHTIAKDPNLATTLLRYANAPLYRRLIEVTNVRNAVSLLGVKNVRLAVVVASMRSLQNDLTPEMAAIIEHCTEVAAIARSIALFSAPFLADDIELTALVHDMGALVLAANLPKEYRKLAARLAVDASVSVLDAENEALGMSRVDVISQLSTTFRLPEVVVKAIQRFFSRETFETLVSAADRHVAILHLAHAMSAYDSPLTREIPVSPMTHWQTLLNLNDEHMYKIRAKVAGR